KSACSLTDAAGRFTLDDEFDTSPILLASREGYVPASRRVGARSANDPIVLVLREGGVRITGTVQDALGGPIVGAWLSATETGGGYRAVAVSDAAGDFRLDVSHAVQIVV